MQEQKGQKWCDVAHAEVLEEAKRLHDTPSQPGAAGPAAAQKKWFGLGTRRKDDH